MSPRTPLFVALLSVALLVPAGAAQAKAKAKPKPAPHYYVALGDSYASGYQPGIGNSKAGYVYQAAKLVNHARPKLNLKVVNFACAGATTSSLLHQVGCPKGALGPGAPSYDTSTQIAAAERFLKANRKSVTLVTVSIGGNDVTTCAQAPDPVACVGEAVAGINANVAETVKRLRKAAGPKATIFGLTYLDVILGEWVKGNHALAEQSVVAFRNLINPALQKQYESVKGHFVNVFEAFGGFPPATADQGDTSGLGHPPFAREEPSLLGEPTDFPPYGSIPTPVIRICQLTWYCSKGDIHPNKAGYFAIGQLVAGPVIFPFEKRP